MIPGTFTFSYKATSTASINYGYEKLLISLPSLYRSKRLLLTKVGIFVVQYDINAGQYYTQPINYKAVAKQVLRNNSINDSVQIINGTKDNRVNFQLLFAGSSYQQWTGRVEVTNEFEIEIFIDYHYPVTAGDENHVFGHLNYIEL